MNKEEKESFIQTRPTFVSPIILGEIDMPSAETQTTVGAAGGASALPATPTGYVKLIINGTEVVMAFYAVS